MKIRDVYKAFRLFVSGHKAGAVAKKLSIPEKDAKHLYRLHIQQEVAAERILQNETITKEYEEALKENERRDIVEENWKIIQKRMPIGFSLEELRRRLMFINGFKPDAVEIILT